MCDCDVYIDILKDCRDALKLLRECFGDDGNLSEQYQDQLSFALEKADAAIATEDKA